MFIWLSHKIDENTPLYGGRKGFTSEHQKAIKRGDNANTSKWQLPNHIGTHIDFPYHFYQDGQTSDDFPPDFWIFDDKHIQIVEVDLPENDLLIKPEHILNDNIKFDAELLLLKTGFDKYRNEEKYWNSNPGLSIEFSDWMKQHFKKLRVLGVDTISISSWQHRDIGRKVHRKLLDPKKPVLIIEDMDLSKVTNGTIFKMTYVAPLLIRKSNGSPCTILAEVEKL